MLPGQCRPVPICLCLGAENRVVFLAISLADGLVYEPGPIMNHDIFTIRLCNSPTLGRCTSVRYDIEYF